MEGVGLFIIALGYAVIYWGIQAIQGNTQDNFLSYIFPFGPNNNTGLPSLGKPLTKKPKAAATGLAQTQKSQQKFGGH